MFEALAKENVNIQMISTSEIKTSVVVDEKYMELAVRALPLGAQVEIEIVALEVHDLDVTGEQ